MPINLQGSPVKLMCSDHAIAKMYCENHVIYSSGNTVTYCVDAGKSYQEEVDEGESCLSPKTFTPIKSGWTFVGWRTDPTANGSVLSDLIMGDDPVTLYAVFRQTVTVTYYNASSTASSTSGYKFYNNGNIANPTFSITPATISGWSFRGWASSSAAAAGIAYSSITNTSIASSVTLYAAYWRTLTLTYAGNGSTGGATAAQTGTQYYNTGNYSNPSFTLSANGFSKTGYNFSKWALGSAGGTQYAVGATITLTASNTVYAVWVAAKAPYYVVKNYVNQKNFDFTFTQLNNCTARRNNFYVGDSYPKISTFYGGSGGANFTAVSQAFPTNNCDTLTVALAYNGSGSMIVNNQYKEGDGTFTFNISGLSSVTIQISCGNSGTAPDAEIREISFS